MEIINDLEKLRKFKERNKWSYDRLSKEIGVHSQTVRGWLKEGHKPSPLASKMLRAFLTTHLD